MGTALAQYLTSLLRTPIFHITECLVQVPAALLSIQVPSSAHPGKQQVIIQVFEFPSPTWETWLEFQVPSFGLVQP